MINNISEIREWFWYVRWSNKRSDIPSSEDKFLGEEPVITPDVQVTSENIVINDIDIPVEIKSNEPIQVEIDNSDNWMNVRQIT